MRTDDQSAVIAYLASPDAHGGAPVTVVDTHASVVFVAGAHAWKLKRAVCYDYLDFSSPIAGVRCARRKSVSIAERRRRSTASGAVTREADGALAVGGAARPSTGSSTWSGSMRRRCWTGSRRVRPSTWP